jgi:PKD repeat protein
MGMKNQTHLLGMYLLMINSSWSARADECPPQRVDLGTVNSVDISAWDNPAHQGIAWDGSHGLFYSSKGDCCPTFHPDLTKFAYVQPQGADPYWDRISQIEVSFTGRAECGPNADHSHVGDIAVGPDGYLYAAVSDFNPPGCGGPGVGGSQFQIVRWSTPDLNYDDYWDMTSYVGFEGDLAGVAFNGADLYAIEWKRNSHWDEPSIFKFRWNNGGLELEDRYDIKTLDANGIAFWQGAVLVTHGTDEHCGSVSVYDLESLIPAGNFDVNGPYATWYFDVGTPGGEEQFWHPEGIEVRNNELWVVAGEGNYPRHIEMPTVNPVCRMEVRRPAACSEIYVGAPVEFDGGASYNPNFGGSALSYQWEAGLCDATGDTIAKTRCTYLQSGNVTASLWVIADGFGDQCGEQFYVYPNNIPDCRAGPCFDNGDCIGDRYFGVENVPVAFNAHATDGDGNGTIRYYDWDFGDECKCRCDTQNPQCVCNAPCNCGVTPGSCDKPTHIYTDNGVHPVTLTVTDDRCATDAATTKAHIGGGPDCVAGAPNPLSAEANDPVTFDGGESRDAEDGGALTYQWHYCIADLSEACIDPETWTYMSDLEGFTHPGFPNANVYKVRLTVTDDDTNPPVSCFTHLIRISEDPNQSPIGVAGGPHDGKVGEPPLFDGRQSSDPDGVIVTYEWDFDFASGGGFTGSGPTPLHVYATSGTRTVRLCVTDNLGAVDDDFTTVTIRGAPVADPGGPYQGAPAVPIIFDASGSDGNGGTIQTYEWDFGDGNVDITDAPTYPHTYCGPGDYEVHLCVRNDGDRMDCAITSASVASPQTRVIAFAASPPLVATGLSNETAVKVTMVDLQNPVPPNNNPAGPCCPPANFITFDTTVNAVCAGGSNQGYRCASGANCPGSSCPAGVACTEAAGANSQGSCDRWVGPPLGYLESNDNPGLGNYRVARLQCTPFYYDWAAEANSCLVNIIGAEIVPSSSYTLQTYGSDCKGVESTCTNVSNPVQVTTRRAGDIATPFQSATPPLTQPNAVDVVNVVNKFRSLANAPSKVIAQVQPNFPEPNADISAIDIVAVVDNVRGFGYTYSGPCVCPSTVPCNTTACAGASACTGLYGAGATCIKTCSSGPRTGQPCNNNLNCGACIGGPPTGAGAAGIPCDAGTDCVSGNCGVGACPTGATPGFCRDRCGRCN